MKVKKISTNKILATMLVLALLLSTLFVGVTLLAPKTTEVKAAGTSATLKGCDPSNFNGNATGSPWFYGLFSSTGVSQGNIVSLTITTTASKIQGFTKGKDVSENQDGSLYLYYKLTGTQVDDYTMGMTSEGHDVVIYGDVDTIYAPTDSNHLFFFMMNCITLTFDNFDTSNVTDMSSMFHDCSALTSLDLSGFNTSNVTDMSWMFAGCSSLTSLDLSSFDTSDVTSVESLFSNCTSLKTLNLKGWDTNLMQDIAFSKYGGSWLGGMFSGCTALETLDISTFTFNEIGDVTKDTVKTCLLKDCTSLKQLHVPANLGDWEIDLPAGVELYVDGAGEPVTTITSAHQGKILTLEGVTPVYPEPDAPDTPAGVDLIDIAIIGALTLTLAVICIAVLMANKKRKVTNRNITIENAKKLINKE